MKVNKSNKFFLLVTSFFILFSLSSCGEQKISDPKAFFEESLKKSLEIKSYYSTSDLKLNIIDSAEGKPRNFDLDINFSGNTDNNVKDDVKTEMDIDFKVNGNFIDADKVDNVSGKVSMKLFKDKFYLKILNLNLPQTNDPSLAMFDTALKMIKDKWLKLSYNYFSETSGNSISDLSKSNSFNLNLINQIFTYQNYKGLNKDLHEIEANLNVDELVKILVESSDNAKSISDVEKQEMKKSIEALNIKSIFYIDNNKNIKEIRFSGNGENIEKKVSLKMDLVFKMDKINQPVNISIPNESEVIDLQQLLGLGIGGMNQDLYNMDLSNTNATLDMDNFNITGSLIEGYNTSN